MGFDTLYPSHSQKSLDADPRANLTRYAYGADGRVASITYPDLTKDTFGYDNEGHRPSLISHGTVSTSYTYDPLGRLIDSFFAGGHTKTACHALGRVKTSTDARKQRDHLCL